LLVLLRTGHAFQHTPVVTHNSQRIAFMHDITDFDKPVSSVAPTVDDVAVMLSTQALSMYIDLGPYVNPPSYIVQASTNAAQTYNLFQSLGLRHLCVVPDTDSVLGVITRKDLLPQHAAEVISNKVWTSADNDQRGRQAQSLDRSDASNVLQAGVVSGQASGRWIR
jgi:CBS-domain-containing membrane protein